ncbi:pyridoxamine 5'-phosphate oxidase family protein [Streptosporangium sp. KLBMP 9127]|nr:pyridoxamine 5'-phosphate oxidase family protein [Streptosporangium sp. KLBMP 9127]
MMLDSAGLHVLSQQECIRLLASARIGRIVFTERALPAVQPVGFALDGDTIVVRAAARSTLAGAAHDAIVAFEADDFNPETRTGWSVTTVGHARAVHDPAEIERLARLPLISWTPGGPDHYIVIQPEQLSGRRLDH